MTNDLIDLLGPELSEPNGIPLSIPVSESILKRYRDVSELTKKVFGRNRVPTIARSRLMAMLDEIETATRKKMKELEEKSA